ncbi:MAG: hypothetical protein KAU62_05255 [Candidatus Heimdallarchaeota archaeon]|nr:hypothetical protein [Candidatus Heimdallarchaeota archaeon]MCG3255473.1 hypothetical protein [Candidatus Heimdallarchaeota archaeon]MCK4610547.1 hypothetical protein [Candidatus Heimdallarchaeota archaeon]
MSENHVFCPKCGEQHSTSGKFCSFCGENLADTILQYKDKRLPVMLTNSVQENEEEPQEKVKKYPSGSPLPEPRSAGKDTELLGQKGGILDMIFSLCCYS